MLINKKVGKRKELNVSLMKSGKIFSLIFRRFAKINLSASKRKSAEVKVNFSHWNALMKCLIFKRTRPTGI